MTAVVVWKEVPPSGDPFLWVAADSLVSDSSGKQLLGDAAKVFTLTVEIRTPDPNGFFGVNSFRHSLGYAFAGSTLVGQNSYLAINPLLASLVSSQAYIPSFDEISDFIHRYLATTYDDLKLTLAERANFAVLVFGWCPRDCELRCTRFVLASNQNNGSTVASERVDFALPTSFAYIGDQVKEASELITTGFEEPEKPGFPTARAPRRILENT